MFNLTISKPYSILKLSLSKLVFLTWVNGLSNRQFLVCSAQNSSGSRYSVDNVLVVRFNSNEPFFKFPLVPDRSHSYATSLIFVCIHLETVAIILLILFVCFQV